MYIYLEKKLHSHPIAEHIIANFRDPIILPIDNYKNIFDKPMAGKIQKSIVIASVNNALLEAPNGYGFEGQGYFLKNSLNCIYDCSYCYLKGAFKNDMQVYFVNYDDIKKQLQTKLESTSKVTWFYSSDYSDNLATNSMTQFCENFIPFFEGYQHARMEIRTKSTNVKPLLALIPANNTEIAFSLNPSEVISKYEHKTPSLDLRIKAVNTLLDAGWKVGLRFLPLLEIENYQSIYERFLDYTIKQIDMEKINSIFIGGLMFTHDDYKEMLKKEPNLDVLYKLEKNPDGFMREKREVREWFYQLFGKKLGEKKCNICLDN